MILFSKSQKLLEPISFHREGIADDKHDGIKGVQVGAPITLQPLGNMTENHHRTPIPGTCRNPTSDPGTLSESWLSFLRAITLNSFFFYF